MAKAWLGTKPYAEYTSATGGVGCVTYDSIGGGSAVNSGTSSVNITWSHTASGTNRIVVVSILVGGVSASYTSYTRTVTYGGTSMTSIQAQNGNADGWIETFYLVNPPTGAKTVSVTVSGSGSFGRVSGNSTSYTGAYQGAIGYSTSGANTSGAITHIYFDGYFGAINIGGGVVCSVFGVDSSTTLTSIISNNAEIPTAAAFPNQGATRWTSNSGATTGMTSIMVADTPGSAFVRAHAFSAGNASFAATQFVILPAGVAFPSGIRGLWLTMIGCGGGGGSGIKSNAGVTRFGGDGGGAGAVVTERYIPVEVLGPTYAVYVSPIAAGGAAASVNGTSNWGIRVPDVTFSTNLMTIAAGSGHGGNPGGTAAPTYASTGGYTGDGAWFGGRGAQGSSGVGGTAQSSLNGTTIMTSGGGGGGGLSIGGGTSGGGSGGASKELGLAGGVGGTTTPTLPGTGSAAVAGLPGSSPGGGAASGTTGQAGGDATAYGAGGGGGGASSSGNSGRGGNGGPGYVRIRWDYS